MESTIETSNRLSKEKWEEITKAPTKNVSDVISMLTKVTVNKDLKGVTFESNEETIYTFMGQEIYNHAKAKTQFPIEKSKTKTKGQNDTKSLIIKNNILRIATENLASVDKYFNMYTKDNIWQFTITSLPRNMECIGYFFLRALENTKNQIIQNKKFMKTIQDQKKVVTDIQLEKNNILEENIYELCVAVRKFINTIINTEFAETLKIDIETMLTSVEAEIEFSPINILTKFPRLTIDCMNKFARIVPKMHGLAPMKHQCEIANKFVENFDNGSLISYVAMAGNGKTTTVISLATIISQLNKIKPYKSCLVFVCNVETVRLDVAKLLYNAGIHFDFVCKGTTTNYVISKPYLFKKNEDHPIVRIVGPDLAPFVITDLNTIGIKPIVFLDEPTVGADCIGHDGSFYNSRLCSDLPNHVIISSATLPKRNDINIIFEEYKKKYPNANIDIEIMCSDVKIGCDIKTYNSAHVTPYVNAESQSDMFAMSENTQKIPFCKRMCTLDQLQKIVNSMATLDFEFDMNHFSRKVENLTPEAISRQVSKLMKQLSSECDDEEIKTMCEYTKSQNSDIDFDHLLDIHTINFDGMNLIASYNPVEFVNTHFSDYLNKIKHVFNFDKELEKYNNSIENYKKALIAHEHTQSILESSKKKKTVDSQGNISVEEKTTVEFTKTEPKFNFPEKFCVNSIEHCNWIKRHNTHIQCGHKHHKIVHPKMEELDMNEFTLNRKNRIDDDYIILLLAGIGVFSQSITSPYYQSCVIEFASSGRLAYVIADDSICFGTNYPFVRTFIEPKFAQNHSINTINQAMSRAGRMGLAWKADAYLPECILPRFTNYMINGVDIKQFDEGIILTLLTQFWIERQSIENEYNSEQNTLNCILEKAQTVTFEQLREQSIINYTDNLMEQTKISWRDAMQLATKHYEKQDKLLMRNEARKEEERKNCVSFIKLHKIEQNSEISKNLPVNEPIVVITPPKTLTSIREISQKNPIGICDSSSKKYIPPSKR
jgi:hypothetical protein